MEDNTNGREGTVKSWISGVFEAITNGFTKALEGIKKHGVMLSLFTVVILILLWSLIINPIHFNEMIEHQFYKYVEQQKTEHANETEESIGKREKANYFVSELMVNIINRYKNVNRVLLLEKHNGTSNLKGVDFLYSSCTYELVNNDLETPFFLYDDLQRQTNLNLLGSNFIQTLKHVDFLYFDDLMKQGTNQSRLLMKLHQVGDSEAIIYSFKDSNHRPLIMLIIGGNNLNVDEITNYIDPFKKQIEELLM